MIQKWKGEIALLFAAFVWGLGFIGVKMALDFGMRPGFIVCVRFAIAALLLFAVFHKSIFHLTRSQLWKGGLAGLLLCLGYIFQTVAQNYTTPSSNAFITSSNVIMVPFLSILFTRKCPPLKSFLCALLCFLGMVILSYQGAQFSFNTGDVLTLCCALCFAAHIAYLAHVSPQEDTKILTFVQMLAAGILSLFYVLLFEGVPYTPQQLAAGIWPILFLGIFPTCIGFFLQTYGQKHLSSPSKVAIILALESTFGSLFSIILGYDILTWNLLLGGLIIIGSLILSEINIKKLPLSAKTKAK